MVDQIEFVRNEIPNLSVIAILAIFRTSSTTYCKFFRQDGTRKEVVANSNQKRANNALADIQEESLLLNWISKRQNIGDCPSPRECRQKMEEIVKKSSKKTFNFSRAWWYRFKAANPELSVIVCSSLEKERATLTAAECTDYMEKIEDLITQTNPQFVFNMDETGFIRRYEKQICKKCVYLKNCTVKPRFVEKIDDHHFSLIACICMDGSPVKPHLLSTRKTLPGDIKATPLMGEFNYSFTKKVI